MKNSFIILFILTSLSLHAIEGNHTLEKARKRWHDFEKKMKWFLAYSTSPAKENLARDLAEHSFLELRTDLFDSIASDRGQNQKAFLIQTQALLTLTDWHVHSLKNFFPKAWLELFRGVLTCQKR